MILCSDEDVDVKGLVGAWLNTQPPQEQQMLSGWLEDYFYKALAFVLKQVGFAIPQGFLSSAFTLCPISFMRFYRSFWTNYYYFVREGKKTQF